MDEYVYQQPAQEPVPARRFPWKPVAAVAGVLIVVGGGVWILWARGQANRQLALVREQAVQNEIAKAEGTCADFTDPAACQKAILDKAAQSMNAPEACKALKDPAALDDCVWGVAASAGDAAICAQMADVALAAACVDGIALKKALGAADEKLCAAIKDETKRAGCVESLAPTNVTNCSARGRSVEECTARTAIEAAQAKRDPSLCTSITADFQDMCQELVMDDMDLDDLIGVDETLFGTDPRKPDTDGDGLKDGEEVLVYHSDPKNPDTDKDGFKDGDEVKQGFSPIGPGKLVTAGS